MNVTQTVVWPEALLRRLLEGTNYKHVKRQPISGMGFDPRISEIAIMSESHPKRTFNGSTYSTNWVSKNPYAALMRKREWKRILKMYENIWEDIIKMDITEIVSQVMDAVRRFTNAASAL